MNRPSPTLQTRGYGLAIIGTMLHAALVAGLYVVLVGFVPTARRMFDEVGISLPQLTQWIMRVSSWVSDYWWTTIPFLVLAGIANFWAMTWLGTRTRGIAVVWMMSVAVLLAALIGLSLLAIEVPMMKLKDGLAK